MYENKDIYMQEFEIEDNDNNLFKDRDLNMKEMYIAEMEKDDIEYDFIEKEYREQYFEELKEKQEIYVLKFVMGDKVLSGYHHDYAFAEEIYDTYVDLCQRKNLEHFCCTLCSFSFDENCGICNADDFYKRIESGLANTHIIFSFSSRDLIKE